MKEHLYNRANCNPYLIGILVGLLSPLITIIYGARQRSWSLAIAPLLAMVIWAISGASDNGKATKYVFQIIAGLGAGSIAAIHRREATANNTFQ